MEITWDKYPPELGKGVIRYGLDDPNLPDTVKFGAILCLADMRHTDIRRFFSKDDLTHALLWLIKYNDPGINPLAYNAPPPKSAEEDLKNKQRIYGGKLKRVSSH